MPEYPCQRYGLLRLPKVTERRDGPRPGDNDDDDMKHRMHIMQEHSEYDLMTNVKFMQKMTSALSGDISVVINTYCCQTT